MAYRAWETYNAIKNNQQIYDQDVHCPMIIEHIASGGTIAGFCVNVGISERSFWYWHTKYETFKECYSYGLTIAKNNWEQEPENNPDFDLKEWLARGTRKNFSGKSNTIRLQLTKDASPYEQYQELIEQASQGEFTASELKQLMEGINVGRVAYETFQLQGEIQSMREDILRMGANNGNNIIPIAPTTKTN